MAEVRRPASERVAGHRCRHCHPANRLSATLSAPGGQLRQADNEVLIDFRNAAGELEDAGTVKLEIDMHMPGMVMHGGGPAEPTATPGQYRAKLKPGMAGDWTAKLSFDGPAGKGETSFAVNVKP